MNPYKSYSKFLVVGATGGTGIQLVKELLNQGKQVKILVRNNTKARTVLKDCYDKINGTLEYQLGENQIRGDQDIIINKELLEAIEWSDIVISALGAPLGCDPQICDYYSTVELINHCEKSNNINKPFVYISSLGITRPSHYFILFLNWLFPYVMGWKALAENRLRQSKLKYFIVRPGGLKDNKSRKPIIISQGDTVFGMIDRGNLARFIVSSLSDEGINKNRSTIEVIESKEDSDREIILKNEVKSDAEDYLITQDHFNTTRNYLMVIQSVIIFVVVYLVLLFKS